MNPMKLSQSLSEFTGFHIGIHTSDATYFEGLLVQAKNDYLVLEMPKDKIMNFNLSTIQAVSKNSKHFQGQYVGDRTQKAETLLDLLTDYQYQWVTINCKNHLSFNGLLSMIAGDHIILIINEERLFIQKSHILNFYCGVDDNKDHDKKDVPVEQKKDKEHTDKKVKKQKTDESAPEKPKKDNNEKKCDKDIQVVEKEKKAEHSKTNDTKKDDKDSKERNDPSSNKKSSSADKKHLKYIQYIDMNCKDDEDSDDDKDGNFNYSFSPPKTKNTSKPSNKHEKHPKPKPKLKHKPKHFLHDNTSNEKENEKNDCNWWTPLYHSKK